MNEFQFTPLREGRQAARAARALAHISIHAPPRGATNRFTRFSTHAHISIHAPPRGATKFCAQDTALTEFQFTPLREGRLYRQQRQTEVPYFNSRPSARGDNRRFCRVDCRKISIHAPPRGATYVVEQTLDYVLFQFTPLREGRLKGGSYSSFGNFQFQFTPLREGRPL